MGVPLVPCHLVYVVAAAVSVALAALAPAGGPLPFGLCGQTVVLACKRVELADKLLYVVPRDTLDRVVGATVFRGVLAHHLLPESLGGLVLAQVETAHRDLVGWPGMLYVPIVLIGLGSHGEGAALDIDHVGSQFLQRVGHRCRSSLRLRTGLRLGGGLGGSGCLGAYDALRSGFGGQGCEHDGDE